MANPVKLQAEISGIDPYGEGVYLLRLKPLGRVPRFKPGQFLHLAVDEFDPSGGFWPESRVFSIASNHGDDPLVIVYSVKGQFTKRMEGELKAGKIIWLKLPYGDFVIDRESAGGRDIVLVAGGTGVSPYMPFLRAYAEDGASCAMRIALYYGVRRASMLMFRDVLAACALKKSFSLHLRIEDEDPAGIDLDCTSLARGRLDIGEIRNEAAALSDPDYYLSGPPGMIRKFKESLLASGVLPESIKIDEWE